MPAKPRLIYAVVADEFDHGLDPLWVFDGFHAVAMGFPDDLPDVEVFTSKTIRACGG